MELDWMGILITLAVFAAGYLWGMYRGMERVATMMLEEPERFQEIMAMTKKIKAEAQQEQEGLEAEIAIEREQGLYYFYTNKGEFLAQGQDFVTVFKHMRDRFPNRGFRIAQHYQQLSAEETEVMVKALYQVFGDKAKSQERQKV
jgi:hypothetical protein